MGEKAKDILEWVFCIVVALVLALIFRYFIGTPTVVKQRSMFPTLKENQRLILNRTMRITGSEPQRGDVITFEAPSSFYTKYDINQSNPIAKYEHEFDNAFDKFLYYIIECTKKSYIKRVIGIAGDHIEIKENKVFLNGEELEEDYLDDDVVTESQVLNDFIVPEGYVFAMGDNRTKSKDSRGLGCIPIEKVEGIIEFRFWPLNVFGKIK